MNENKVNILFMLQTTILLVCAFILETVSFPYPNEIIYGFWSLLWCFHYD